MKEIKDAAGQTMLRGMSAAVGICHGPVVKVCPHSTTGEVLSMYADVGFHQ